MEPSVRNHPQILELIRLSRDALTSHYDAQTVFDLESLKLTNDVKESTLGVPDCRRFSRTRLTHTNLKR